MELSAEAIDLLADKIANRLHHIESTPLTREELAERLRVSPQTIDRWRKSGIIPGFKRAQTVLFFLPDVLTAMRESN